MYLPQHRLRGSIQPNNFCGYERRALAVLRTWFAIAPRFAFRRGEIGIKRAGLTAITCSIHFFCAVEADVKAKFHTH